MRTDLDGYYDLEDASSVEVGFLGRRVRIQNDDGPDASLLHRW